MGHTHCHRRMTTAPWRHALHCAALACLLVATTDAAEAEPPAGSSAACARFEALAAQAQMHAPFELVDGRIYVRAQVNGRGPFRFAVDTGASGAGRADSALVTALALPLLGTTTHSDGVSSSQQRTTRLATLELAGYVQRDLEVITRDYASQLTAEARFAGILGRGFFADGLLLIDYPARMLWFSRSAQLAPGDGALPYTRAFRIPVSIAGVASQGNLDTGANVAFVLPQALYARLGAGPQGEAATGTLSNGTVDTRRVTVAGPVRVGDLELSNVEARVSERYPELLIGAHALQQAALMLDQRTQRVAVCRR